MTSPEQFTIPVNDHTITLLRYLPNITYYDLASKLDDEQQSYLRSSGTTVSGVIFFAPALAVPQLYYKYCLDYFSSHGYLVISMDYVGIGLSHVGSLKESPLEMQDWINDLEAATQWTLDNYHDILTELGLTAAEIDDLPLYYQCHSLGGQFFGFLSNQNRFTKFVGATSQNGYWRYYKTKYRYFFFWYFAVNPLIWLNGYFPKWAGLGEALPPKVMKTWKKWCTSRNYLFDDPNYFPQYDQYQHQMLTVGFTDDPWATKAAIDDLYQHYNHTDRVHWHLDPSDFDLKAIGHFGYYKPRSIKIWQKTLDWLEQ